MTTRPNTPAKRTNSSAIIPTTALNGVGNTNQQATTLIPITTAPRKPITATRRLVKCNLATPLLTPPGIAAVSASERTNQKSIASKRKPKYVGDQLGESSPVGLRIIAF